MIDPSRVMRGNWTIEVPGLCALNRCHPGGWDVDMVELAAGTRGQARGCLRHPVDERHDSVWTI